jgi:hypothetical protein
MIYKCGSFIVMGCGSSTSVKEKPTETDNRVAPVDKFATKSQTCDAMTYLHKEFEIGTPETVLAVVISINKGLLSLNSKAPGAEQKVLTNVLCDPSKVVGDYLGPDMTFKGVMGLPFSSLMYVQLTRALELRGPLYYNGSALLVDGMKPMILAYLATLDWNLGGTYRETANKWLLVAKEMSKNPIFKLELSDTAFGYTLLELMTDKAGKFLYDNDLSTSWLAGHVVTDFNVLVNLVANEQYAILEKVLSTADCKELLSRRNLFYEIERRGLVGYIGLVAKYGSAEVIDLAYSELPCYNYAIELKRYGDFLSYNPLNTKETLAVLARVTSFEDYAANKVTINEIVKRVIGRYTRESVKPIIDVMMGKRLFELANYVVDNLPSTN